MPGSIFRAGLLEHFVHSVFILVPFVAVTPVFICDLPLLLRGILPLCEAFQLGILVDLYPELNDHRAPLGQFLLELVDLVICPLPVVSTAEAFQPFYHDASVPGTVKNGDMPGLRKSRPKSPEIMSRFLVGFRAGDGVYLVASGIQCSCDPLDIAALARGIPAFVGDDYRNLLAIQAVMQGIQLLL